MTIIFICHSFLVLWQVPSICLFLTSFIFTGPLEWQNPLNAKFFLLGSFSHQRKVVVFYWSLSDSKSSQVSRTLLCIQTDLNNAIMWMVSTRPFISKTSRPCTNPLVTIPSVPITIGITITFKFYSFFQFSSKVLVFIFLFTFLQFYCVVSQNSKVDYLASSLFFW